MLPIERTIERLGGLARTRDLEAAGFWQSMIQLFSNYGVITNVCRGWWATRHTSPAAVAARRAGGRLACISALAHHGEIDSTPPELHVALGRSRWKPTQAGIVVHWSRAELPGDRAAVAVEVARQQAQRCAAAATPTLTLYR